MKPERKNPIPESKIKSVEELLSLIKNKKTILIASIKNIPASQFQEIGKKLRDKAIIKILKKNLVFRALDSSENEEIKKLKEHIKNSVALLFSDMGCFDLATELIENKSPAKAKAGQEVPEDIEIGAGPTDLVPGPAISELGALGIEIQIEKGKIHIKKPKIIAKKGEKISKEGAELMNKLDIKPFSIGFIPLCAFDNQEKKLYLNINIDKEGTLKKLKADFGKALAFAVEINYVSKDTIKFLISKAGAHERVLKKIAEVEVSEEKKEEKSKDEIKDETDKPLSKKDEELVSEKVSDETDKHQQKISDSSINKTPQSNESQTSEQIKPSDSEDNENIQKQNLEENK